MQVTKFLYRVYSLQNSWKSNWCLRLVVRRGRNEKDRGTGACIRTGGQKAMEAEQQQVGEGDDQQS